jgi:radical SAM superfamily enzyme YgiQ (UPF0313 family)
MPAAQRSPTGAWIDAKWDGRLAFAASPERRSPAVRGRDFADRAGGQRRPVRQAGQARSPRHLGRLARNFAAQQAMEDPWVDIVVRGMGERTLVEVVRAIEASASLRDIAGIHYRDGGTIASTPDRRLEDINNFPRPAYDLMDPARYLWETPEGDRQAFTIFSRGCPFACEFCLVSKNCWLGLTIDRMIADIEFWIGRGANRILFYDGNFFLGSSRLLEFCDALLARDLPSRFRWIATAVGRRVAKMDDELLATLKRAGLMQVAIGAESGSDELLSRITNKTTVETTLEAVRRLTRHGINQHLFFMVGYPDEPSDALTAYRSLLDLWRGRILLRARIRSQR